MPFKLLQKLLTFASLLSSNPLLPLSSGAEDQTQSLSAYQTSALLPPVRISFSNSILPNKTAGQPGRESVIVHVPPHTLIKMVPLVGTSQGPLLEKKWF